MSKGVMTVMKGQKLVGNIYKLLGTTVVGGVATAKSELDNTVLWHMQLGHMGERGTMELHKRNLLKGIKTCKMSSLHSVPLRYTLVPLRFVSAFAFFSLYVFSLKYEPHTTTIYIIYIYN